MRHEAVARAKAAEAYAQALGRASSIHYSARLLPRTIGSGSP